MIGERLYAQEESNYGTLTMRPYVIQGNELDAFYDTKDNLIFVLDKTINENKPNVLLVINPVGDKKWDEILSGQYLMDLEMIRPKVDNKYRKLDIEYSGLSVYDNLINAYVAGDGIEEQMIQLNVLRDSAVRHSAMMRLNMANEIISKTNITIVKTKESIIRLQERVKTLRAKLSATKREIGKVSTKQSAAKILRIESQIEAANEKLKRAKKRLVSAQRRLETATVDAELASSMLNQPALEIPQPVKVKPVVAAPKRQVKKVEPEIEDEKIEYNYNVDVQDSNDEDEEEIESDVEPLFTEDPKIMNEDIAFKPISFDTNINNSFEIHEEEKEESEEEPQENEEEEEQSWNVSQEHEESEENEEEEEQPAWTENESVVERPVLETLTPIEEPKFDSFEPVPVTNSFEEESAEEDFHYDAPRPVLETLTPTFNNDVVEPEPSVPTYNNIDDSYKPVPPATENTEEEKTTESVAPVINDFSTEKVAPVVTNAGHKTPFMYYVFLILLICLSVFTLLLYKKSMSTATPDLATPVVEEIVVEEPVIEPEPVVVEEEPVVEPEPVVVEEEPVIEPEPVVEEDTEPTIMGAVPSKYLTSGQEDEDDVFIESVVNKPVYEAGSRHDNMFVSETSFRKQKTENAPDVKPTSVQQPARAVQQNYYDENDVIFDDEYYY